MKTGTALPGRRWRVAIVSGVVVFAISLIEYCVAHKGCCSRLVVVPLGLVAAGVFLVSTSLIVLGKGQAWVRRLAACIAATVVLYGSVYPNVIHLMVFHLLHPSHVADSFARIDEEMRSGLTAGRDLQRVYWCMRGQVVYVLFTVSGDWEGQGFHGFLHVSQADSAEGRMTVMSDVSLEYSRIWSHWYAAWGQ